MKFPPWGTNLHVWWLNPNVWIPMLQCWIPFLLQSEPARSFNRFLLVKSPCLMHQQTISEIFSFWNPKMCLLDFIWGFTLAVWRLIWNTMKHHWFQAQKMFTGEISPVPFRSAPVWTCHIQSRHSEVPPGSPSPCWSRNVRPWWQIMMASEKWDKLSFKTWGYSPEINRIGI